MSQEQYDAEYGNALEEEEAELKRQAKKLCRRCYAPCTSTQNFLDTLTSFMPVLLWLPRSFLDLSSICQLLVQGEHRG